MSTAFSNNILDSTKDWQKVLTEKSQVEGLSNLVLSQLSHAFKRAFEKESTPEHGPWLLTLSGPDYQTFMQHGKDRALREELYYAYLNRCSDGKFENKQNALSILRLRQTQARLLGFSNYAEFSLATKMASSVDEIKDLFESIRLSAMKQAQTEFKEILEFANAQGCQDLSEWDLKYWSKRLWEKKFELKDEELKPYFPLPAVLSGMFALVERLFDIRVEQVEGEAPVWHDDVMFFHVNDANSKHIASFYLDPYSRPVDKRSGAWMSDCRNRRALDDGNVQTPIAYLACNQTPPTGQTPSLMTFTEVLTLFHEFGHGLQHMLTSVDELSVAGINGIEWDAVELPSQFMENWLYDKNTLIGLSSHYRTGEKLPEAVFEKIVASKNHGSGIGWLRQAKLSHIDLCLHSTFYPEEDDLLETYDKIALPFNYKSANEDEGKILYSFGHIFAGGYAAGYYSYMWADVLSADAFEAFEDVGLEDANATRIVGKKFRETVLGLGGSLHPSEVFKAFRGREPRTDAFMRHNGLTKS